MIVMFRRSCSAISALPLAASTRWLWADIIVYTREQYGRYKMRWMLLADVECGRLRSWCCCCCVLLAVMELRLGSG